MKYMMLIRYDESAWEERDVGERQRIYGGFMRSIEQMQSRGKHLDGNPLQPAATGAAVRVRDGKTLVTDGPYLETREQLGGYFVIDAKSLDEAKEIATRIPSAQYGTVEVRPIMDLEEHFGGSLTSA